MTDATQIITTIDNRAAADRLAHTLVHDHLAACVQIIGPIASTYRWQDEMETAEEWLCLIKTTAARYTAVEEAIRRLHSYDVPEILAMPVTAGSQPYLQWLAGQV